MNKDLMVSALTKAIILVAGTYCGTTVSQPDAATIASGAVALGALLYGVYQHYGMRKVPQGAVVTAIAPTVAAAKAASIPAAK